MNDATADVVIDCRNLSCPGPLVQITKVIRGMQPGQTLEVSASDRAFCEDVKAWCEMSGNDLVEVCRNDGQCKARIKKA